MLGHAEEWFYRYLAGIDFDLSRPTGKQLILRPTPVLDVNWATAEYKTPLGLVESRWKKEGGTFQFDAVVPPGLSAEVILPSPKSVAQHVSAGRHHFELPGL